MDCFDEIGDSIDDTLLEFCKNEYSDCSNFDDIKIKIRDVEIKNTRNSEISEFTLQIYAYAYQKIMDFLRERFDHHLQQIVFLKLFTNLSTFRFIFIIQTYLGKLLDMCMIFVI